MVKEFMGKDFLLNSEPAIKMFEAADKMPIFDWHCHLSPKEIYENKQPEDIAWLWLAGDHYKWRAMRICGTPERCVTGDATDYEKWLAFCTAAPKMIGSPLYHWAHLELQRYFGITETLSEDTAEKIWKLTTIATTVGFSDEYIHLYAASDLKPGKIHPDSDEFINVVKIPLTAALQMVESGKIFDAKSAVSILLLAKQVFHKK